MQRMGMQTVPVDSPRPDPPGKTTTAKLPGLIVLTSPACDGEIMGTGEGGVLESNRRALRPT